MNYDSPLSQSTSIPVFRELPSQELSHLNYRRFLPHPQLPPWVQCYWSVQVDCAMGHKFEERLYPDGGVSITLNLANPSRHWVSAQQRLHTLTVAGRVDSFGIRFHPGGAQWLLQTDLSELARGHFGIMNFAFKDIDQLTDRLSYTSRIENRVGLTNAWLLSQLRRLQPEVNIAQLYVPQLLLEGFEVASWCRANNLNRRTLERAFQFYVGVSPGQLKSLQQVKCAREIMKTEHEESLASIAQTCGFYDQAHFTRQFQKVTGQTPGQYRRRQRLKAPAP